MSVTPLARISATHPAPAFRGRIGQDARSGHYAVPRRYRLHLAAACADGLRIAVVHSLLGLDDICPVTLLDPVPDCPDGGIPRCARCTRPARTGTPARPSHPSSATTGRDGSSAPTPPTSPATWPGTSAADVRRCTRAGRSRRPRPSSG